MGKKGIIDTLPEETRRLLQGLRDRGHTITAIHEKLLELDVEVSRGTVGRWVKDYDELGEELAEIRAAAEGLMKPIIERGGDDRTSRLNIELMQALLFKLSNAARGGKIAITPQDMMFLSRATKDLQAAIKAISDAALVEIKVRRELQTDQAKKLAAAAPKAGLNKDQVAFIRAEILGVDVDKGEAGNG
ncbi:phage protein Gp27 family protein [Ferrovibrio terrae]|uniref:phage protein Gp27 family protein n=1 Tax=Ferrovibrio terrae TaxID=2594003 RepID=UPI0031384882